MSDQWDPPRRKAPPRKTVPPKAGRHPVRKPIREPIRRPEPQRRRPPKRARLGGNHRLRIIGVRFALVAALVAAGLKLVQVQGFEAAALSAKANKQRVRNDPVPAQRGDIVDRNGVKLAFSVDTKTLAWSPKVAKQGYEKAKLDYDTRIQAVAAKIKAVLGDAVDERALLDKMRSDGFSYLVDNVTPAQERQITKAFPEVIAENRAVREYPGGDLASNIIGFANWRSEDQDVKKHNIHGLFGLENDKDSVLAGEPGSQTVDTQEGADGVIIPGTVRDVRPAKDGANVELTIDADVQYDVQRKLTDYVAKSAAKGGSVVVMDAHTGEVYALANDKNFDPTDSKGPNGLGNTQLTANPAVTTPYEPGSVNKVVTASSVIEFGIAKPDDPITVQGTHKVADRTIRDAWPHGPLRMTTTGVFAKSSNVGTLDLAEEVGPDRYAEMLKKFGLGQKTGLGLPGESAGVVPDRKQWSGSTFGNLPIGQGLSMTILQMTGMYQTIANNGLRVSPRIIKATIDADGTRHEEPRPEGVRVVSDQTAQTVRDMLRAVVQKAPGGQNGTGPAAALAGYQISGKTGTAQQPEPGGGGYSQTLYWITFAGILPADNPRFVVGIMLDRTAYTDGGNQWARSAAPLFHDIASYLAQRFNLPLSKDQSPVVPLVLN
ncbi:peptidoglycan D,D-transpeptidase FtsI family protein [Actinocrispum wychmicini]|uniref:Cell division protein FtsI (Penicillin-binding protein 3) n=1 Tax=Actinocrispum wychmicini TaxID=1213861 RepID=A0A4R2JI51_9PSEU|nr:penicillin-binding protein 2 [Actinocrispum wychmicini]TCO56676.1 cell division protein FtsI (penicillin-binding protein 3) [Actinocrispum wychmicini]